MGQFRLIVAVMLLLLGVEATVLRLLDLPRETFPVDGGRLRRWGELARKAAVEFPQSPGHRHLRLRPRLARLRAAGYFSDHDRSVMWAPRAEGRAQTVVRYYSAQYALAPTILDFDKVHPLVVVDCSGPDRARAVLRRRRLEPVLDLGGGLVLARPAGS